jgi:hypothetical protein
VIGISNGFDAAKILRMVGARRHDRRQPSVAVSFRQASRRVAA